MALEKIMIIMIAVRVKVLDNVIDAKELECINTNCGL